MSDKIYKVTSINCLHFELEAKETDLSADDVEESELWNVSDFREFCIRLVNDSGMCELIDFGEWDNRNKS